jgi:uncharacterized protein (DUF58 family)
VWLLAGFILLTLGLLARRSDVAALGVAPLLTVAWSWLHRPTAMSTGGLREGEQQPGTGRLVADVDLLPAAGSELTTFRVSAPGHQPAECLVRARERSLRATMHTVRTGRRYVFRLDFRSASRDQLWVTEPTSVGPVEITVLPTTSPLALVPLPHRLQGLTGPHGSRRAGDGGDLHDVAEFAPGDRLRRIDWRVTSRLNTGPARTGLGGPAGSGKGALVTKLYVRRTFATADATVMLVVDSRDEIGPRVSTWDSSTSLREDEASTLDIARVAAASVAGHYLGIGDRVGLEDLGRRRRPVPPAGGRSQLHRLVRRLALAEPAGEPPRRKRVPRLPSGALIIIFSTFLDEDPAHMAATWRRAGHRVVAVDVLPKLIMNDLSSRMRTAYRVVSMERADRIRRLTSTGVEMINWPSAANTAQPRLELAVLTRQRARR